MAPIFAAVLDRLLLGELTPGARILDLCCGSGDLAAELTFRGFAVSGIDLSRELLKSARRLAPEATFLVADARSFAVGHEFDAVVSVHDSLNHMLDEADLRAVFENVLSSLREGGRFVCDINTDARYDRLLREMSIVADDRVCLIRGSYDASRRFATFDNTLFTRDHDVWRRSDVRLVQRAYQRGEVETLLSDVGFDVTSVHSDEELGIPGAGGKLFFKAVRPG